LCLAQLLIEFVGVRPTWKRLIDGQCGIVNIRDRDPKFATLPSQVAGVIPPGKKVDGGWNPKEWLQPGVSVPNLVIFPTPY
jgi:3-oxoacyl-[acyl-carrier-protein] synthase II